MKTMKTLKSIEQFRQAAATFNEKIAEMDEAAAKIEATVAKMEIEQVEALSAGDVAHAVITATKIVLKKGEAAAGRASVSMMTANKAKGFAKFLEDVRIEADNVRIEGEKKYAAQEAKVLKVRDAYLSELEALGGIRAEVIDAHAQFKTVAQEIENMKPQGERKDLYRSFPLRFEQKPLFKLADSYNPNSKFGVIGLGELTQEKVYAGTK